jgi:hypothetical protein
LVKGLRYGYLKPTPNLQPTPRNPAQQVHIVYEDVHSLKIGYKSWFYVVYKMQLQTLIPYACIIQKNVFLFVFCDFILFYFILFYLGALESPYPCKQENV